MAQTLRLVLTVLLLAGTSGTLRAAEPDSLRANFFSAVAFSNPSQAERVTVDGDTVGNPFDYVLQFGLTGGYGKTAFRMAYEYRRQNDLNHVDQEYELRYRTEQYEVGARLLDQDGPGEAGDLYTFRIWVEGRLFSWIGVGITRQHLSPWFGQAAILARFTLARNRFTFWKLQTTLKAEFETNPRQNRLFFYADVKSFTWGRFAVVPAYRYERIKPNGSPAKSTYGGFMTITVSL